MPKKVDHEIRRKELAAAAAALIAEHGAHRVKLTDVAKRAGCTTGAIVYFFSNKDALWLEAIRYAYEQQLEGLQSTNANLYEMVRLALPTSPEQEAAWRLSISLAEYAVWHSEITEELRPLYRALEDFFRTQCSLAIEQGHLPKNTDIEMTMSTLWAWLDGLATQATQDPERWPAHKQEAALSHVFSLLQWNDSPTK